MERSKTFQQGEWNQQGSTNQLGNEKRALMNREEDSGRCLSRRSGHACQRLRRTGPGRSGLCAAGRALQKQQVVCPTRSSPRPDLPWCRQKKLGLCSEVRSGLPDRCDAVQRGQGVWDDPLARVFCDILMPAELRVRGVDHQTMWSACFSWCADHNIDCELEFCFGALIRCLGVSGATSNHPSAPPVIACVGLELVLCANQPLDCRFKKTMNFEPSFWMVGNNHSFKKRQLFITENSCFLQSRWGFSGF